MRLPTSLKVGGHVIRIELTNQLPEEVDGDYQTEKLLIRIRESLPQSMQEATLIHEILHALNGTFDSDTLGHSLLDSLAEQLYQVLADNKLLA